ncbi:MAG TPA: ATP-binding protein [Bacteroidetes bacterium]|nr:ATP-binding protein [Bacteroidota bacterium]
MKDITTGIGAVPSNAANLHFALDYLRQVVKARLQLHFQPGENGEATAQLPSLGFFDDGSVFSRFITERQPSFEEYVILLLALAPHVQPDFLGKVIQDALPESGDFSEMGGIKGTQHRGFLPTGETALFLLAGDDLERRFEIQHLFSTEHWFYRDQVLYLGPPKEADLIFSGRIILQKEFVEKFTVGTASTPPLSTSFPAQRISTRLNWDDLVLPGRTLHQIEQLKWWMEYNDTLMKDWGMGSKLKPGFRALFHGPPGTGKTLTATLLGKYTGREVFRVDLSMVVSKYIGETEKNLSQLFDKARNKDWILFFDEADALFGKRTNVRDAHDKYANQEVSYLLQRIEGFAGLTILASNFKSNIDDAFLRRFNAIIFFPVPNVAERLRLWQKGFPENVRFGPEVDFHQLAARYELTGSNIMNVVQAACLHALAEKSDKVELAYIEEAVKNELQKEGKVV